MVASHRAEDGQRVGRRLTPFVHFSAPSHAYARARGPGGAPDVWRPRFVRRRVTASMMGVLIGPAGAAFAAGPEPELGLASSESQTPDVLEALDVVPGLEGAGDPTSTAEVLDSSMGSTVEGSSGSSTTIERVDASGASTAAYSEAGETVVEESSTDTDTVVQQLPDGARVLEGHRLTRRTASLLLQSRCADGDGNPPSGGRVLAHWYDFSGRRHGVVGG